MEERATFVRWSTGKISLYNHNLCTQAQLGLAYVHRFMVKNIVLLLYNTPFYSGSSAVIKYIQTNRVLHNVVTKNSTIHAHQTNKHILWFLTVKFSYFVHTDEVNMSMFIHNRAVYCALVLPVFAMTAIHEKIAHICWDATIDLSKSVIGLFITSIESSCVSRNDTLFLWMPDIGLNVFYSSMKISTHHKT